MLVPGWSFFYADFKAFQVDLSCCSFGYNRVASHTLLFLVVECETFQKTHRFRSMFRLLLSEHLLSQRKLLHRQISGSSE